MTKTKAKKDREREERHNRVLTYFDAAYGRDETKLEMWQSLCMDLGVPEGRSITQCKKNLKGTYVNIVDFVADRMAGRPVRSFSSYKALRNYIDSQERAKTFPLGKAKNSPILKWMLIKVL